MLEETRPTENIEQQCGISTKAAGMYIVGGAHLHTLTQTYNTAVDVINQL